MNKEESNNTCPIKLDKIHCQNCYFMRDKCEYEKIIKMSNKGCISHSGSPS